MRVDLGCAEGGEAGFDRYVDLQAHPNVPADGVGSICDPTHVSRSPRFVQASRLPRRS